MERESLKMDEQITQDQRLEAVRPKSQREVKAQVSLRSEESAPAGDAIIQVRSLDFYYDTFQALKGLDLDIRKNEITALIGPSGCGKSTFLRTLNRMNDLIPKTRKTGSILLNGREIYRDIDIMVLRKKVGMVFQKPNPFDMSIYDNVAFGPRIHGMKNRQQLDEVVETSLRKAAIWDEIKDRLHDNGLSISGGQQQRLCIARTLATNPEIILMDEPTSALDPISTKKIEELMEVLKSEYSVVIVTHNMQQAARTADETVFFLNGEIIESGRTGKIFVNPVDHRTEEYISGRFG